MLFRSARITATNEGKQDVNSFYSNIVYQLVPELPADALYFHAQYRQATPTEATTNDWRNNGDANRLKNTDGKLNYVFAEARAIGGHSMGASILWSYIEQFGSDRISKFIFIDQAPVVTNGFGLEGQVLKETGAAFTPDVLYATAAGVANAQSAVLDGLKGAFFSASISDAVVAFNNK